MRECDSVSRLCLDQSHELKGLIFSHTDCGTGKDRLVLGVKYQGPEEILEFCVNRSLEEPQGWPTLNRDYMSKRERMAVRRENFREESCWCKVLMRVP